MPYALFLLIFLGVPLVILAFITFLDNKKLRNLPAGFTNLPIWQVIGIHVLVAVIYTTPWDNYLIATRVWFYQPKLVLGLTLGWVPVEEYTFFILQSILIGLWLSFLAKRIQAPVGNISRSKLIRFAGVFLMLVFFCAGLILLWAGWHPGTYLALILVWAIPPIGLQMFFGADILWQRGKLVLAVLLPATLYLSAADCLAIGSGTWTIDPHQSLNSLIGGILPLEEFVFFLVTNMLLTFGMVLLQSQNSRRRSSNWFSLLKKANLRSNNNPAKVRGAYVEDRENQYPR